jgi:phosphoglycolate phosphatase-like HAD superfamily hydrolase
MKARIRAIILDFDGVLVDSNERKLLAYEDLFELYPDYRDAMIRYHRNHIAQPRLDKFAHICGTIMGHPGNEEVIHDMACRFTALVVRRIQNSPDVPGVRSFLEEFHSRVPLYVASLIPHDELWRSIRACRFERYFVDAFGHPPFRKDDAIREVLKRERVLPEDVVLVGDSPSDLEAATVTGVEFIGRDSGTSFTGIPVTLFRDLHEIAAILRPRIS